MSTPISRRLKTAVLVAIACVVATQASAVVTASAAPLSPDGGPSAASANTDRSQTPLQVRNKSAKLVAPLAATQHLRVSIGVKPRDLAAQEQFVKAVQDRRSPLFHQYLTAAQWNARFAPSAADEAAVVAWAKSAGLDRHAPVPEPAARRRRCHGRRAAIRAARQAQHLCPRRKDLLRERP